MQEIIDVHLFSFFVPISYFLSYNALIAVYIPGSTVGFSPKPDPEKYDCLGVLQFICHQGG